MTDGYQEEQSLNIELCEERLAQDRVIQAGALWSVMADRLAARSSRKESAERAIADP